MMKNYLKILFALLIILSLNSCRNCEYTETDEWYSEHCKYSSNLIIPSEKTQVLILLDSELFQVCTSVEIFDDLFNGLGERHYAWRFKSERDTVNSNRNLDTINCVYPVGDRKFINPELICLLVRRGDCWVYDKRTKKYALTAIIDDWSGGSKKQWVGSAGVTIYISDIELVTDIHTQT